MMECILLYSFVMHLRMHLQDSFIERALQSCCVLEKGTASLHYALYIWCNLYSNALSSRVLNKPSLFCCYLQGRALRVVHGMCFGYLRHDGVDLQVQETEGEY